MASELGYRVYRLRRLIAVCLALVAAAAALAVWLLPGAVGAVQVVFGLGLFSVFAMAQLAMIVIWPRDAGGPLAYALGLIPVLGVAVLFGVKVVQDDMGHLEMLTALVTLFALPVWLFLVPLVGGLFLWPLGRLARHDVQLQRVFDLPLPVDTAIEVFGWGPDKVGQFAATGPVGWDGFWEERTPRQVADATSGAIVEQVTVNRFRLLEGDAMSRSVLAEAKGDDGTLRSIVMHQSFSAMAAGTGARTGAGTGAGTRLTERFHIDCVLVLEQAGTWLADISEDHLTAELDALAGRAPRAIAHLPMDTMGASIARFLKWGDPPVG